VDVRGGGAAGVAAGAKREAEWTPVSVGEFVAGAEGGGVMTIEEFAESFIRTPETPGQRRYVDEGELRAGLSDVVRLFVVGELERRGWRLDIVTLRYLEPDRQAMEVVDAT
jgi:hypothetical protein